MLMYLGVGLGVFLICAGVVWAIVAVVQSRSPSDAIEVQLAGLVNSAAVPGVITTIPLTHICLSLKGTSKRTATMPC